MLGILFGGLAACGTLPTGGCDYIGGYVAEVDRTVDPLVVRVSDRSGAFGIEIGAPQEPRGTVLSGEPEEPLVLAPGRELRFDVVTPRADETWDIAGRPVRLAGDVVTTNPCGFDLPHASDATGIVVTVPDATDLPAEPCDGELLLSPRFHPPVTECAAIACTATYGPAAWLGGHHAVYDGR